MTLGYRQVDDNLDEYEDDFIDASGDLGADGYGDANDGKEEEEEEEEVEEEVEEESVSEETLRYLDFRQKLKEEARSKLRKENGYIDSKLQDTKGASSLVKFGSFFGPARPFVADRVIQESKSFLETRHLAGKQPSSGKIDTMSLSLEPRNQLSSKSHSNQSKSKAQMIKQNRDFYSFLSSDDAELPKPGQNPNLQKNIVSDTAQVTAETSKSSLNSVRKAPNGFERHKHSTSKISTSQKPISGRRPNLLSCDSKRQLDPRKKQVESNKQFSGNNRGLARPAMPKDLPLKKLSSVSGRKVPAVEKKTSLPAESKTSTVVKNSILNGQRRPPLKSQTCVIGKNVVHKRDVQHSKEEKMLKDSIPSSEFQTVKSSKQNSVRSSLGKDQYDKEQKPLATNSNAPGKILNNKKRKSDEEFPDDQCDYISLIREMFGRPRHYNDVDDDDRNMEVSFHEIQREEKRSARLAKKEDDEELAKIEEEERLERLRKQAKLRKKQC